MEATNGGRKVLTVANLLRSLDAADDPETAPVREQLRLFDPDLPVRSGVPDGVVVTATTPVRVEDGTVVVG